MRGDWQFDDCHLIEPVECMATRRLSPWIDSEKVREDWTGCPKFLSAPWRVRAGLIVRVLPMMVCTACLR